MESDFFVSQTPFPLAPKVRRIHFGDGQVYYIYKERLPYLEVETGQCHNNPFDAVLVFGHYFCIGSGEAAYFVDLLDFSIKKIEFGFYFGYFYPHGDALYVASDSELLRLDSECRLVWRSGNIAVDGVVVDCFLEDGICVSCEVDPPGGWVARRLAAATGKEF